MPRATGARSAEGGSLRASMCRIAQEVALPAKKDRVPIPSDLAARVLFDSDRTCCVCRIRKPVQIHHIDDNPSHNEHTNLAVLCFDCHRDTQIQGGFDRKLDAEQVRLYRKHWLDAVQSERTAFRNGPPMPTPDKRRLAARLAEIEIWREQEDWWRVAKAYDTAGDTELRDRYIEKFLERDSSPWAQLLAARLQGRVDSLAPEVQAAVIETLEGEWTSKGRALLEFGDVPEAVRVLLRGVTNAVEEGRWFPAAFYLRHVLEAQAVDELFKMALRDAVERDDIWWQLRAYEELGWKSEAKALLIANEDRIRQEGRPTLRRKLASALGSDEEFLELTKEIATLGVMAHFSVQERAEVRGDPVESDVSGAAQDAEPKDGS